MPLQDTSEEHITDVPMIASSLGSLGRAQTDTPALLNLRAAEAQEQTQVEEPHQDGDANAEEATTEDNTAISMDTAEQVDTEPTQVDRFYLILLLVVIRKCCSAPRILHCYILIHENALILT